MLAEGVSQVFAAWVIAPVISGIFGAIVFNIAKYTILKRKNPVRSGLIMLPIFFAFTAGVLTMVIVWKGAPSLDLDDWDASQIVGTIFGVATAVALLSSTLLLPYLYRKLVLNDWQLKLWHIFLGPLLLRRGPVPERPEGSQAAVVQDYYRGHKTKAALEANGVDRHIVADLENKEARVAEVYGDNSSDEISREIPPAKEVPADMLKPGPAVPWYKNPEYRSILGAFKLIKKAFLHGVEVDVVAEQKKSSILRGDLEKMHAHAQHFDNKTEHLFSYLQVMTAATASFAHGANDVSNAIGPLAAIFLIWNTGDVSSKAPVPIWILCFGGASIVIGLW